MDNRFKPPYLERSEIQEVRNQLRLSMNRRESFLLGASLIRLLVDGDEQLSFDPVGKVQTTIRVHPSALFMELHGDDDCGDILLAAFLIPDCQTSIGWPINQVALRHPSGHLTKIRISSLRSGARWPAQTLLKLSCNPICRWT